MITAQAPDVRAIVVDLELTRGCEFHPVRTTTFPESDRLWTPPDRAS
jgi:hypothetical protein